MTAPDALIVGSGPNGLAAAIRLAQSGRHVRVLEACPVAGGGTRSAELTLPGFLHDICSAVHPLAAASPFFRTLPLAEYGLEWVHPPAPLAHPFDDGTAAVLERSITETAHTLDATDTKTYVRLVAPFVAHWERLFDEILAPLHRPAHPFLLARFGLRGLRSAEGLARSMFAGERARGLFAGLAAHSLAPLDAPPTAAFGLVLAVAAHAVGWPFARGGSQRIADALLAYLHTLGAEVITDAPVHHLDELPATRHVLLDVTPRQLLRIAGARFRAAYRRRLEAFRYGPGVFKIDWALAGPIPWTARACTRAGTIHLGGTFAEVAAAEAAAWNGKHSERPFVLLAQPSLVDPTRAPDGRHTAWAYCHVPHGSTTDMTAAIEAQVERFAPGFRDLILARSTMNTASLESHDANLVGGDIAGGANTLLQTFFRPVARRVPYATPVPGLYLCSASTPPGGGVHGMCGYHAAGAALRRG
ncbi:MAG TPA: NAD(P)/FAD-dependent oxidoreductase [Longimicrobiales bacterium]